MGRNRKKLPALVLALSLALSGCSIRSPEELYALPQATEASVELQALITETRGEREYAVPLAGSNTQTVQMVDLNGDGRREAITFFRDSTAEKPLQICIFNADEAGDYKLGTVIEDEGTAINSVEYSDLNGDGNRELLVSWQISNLVHTLVTYSLRGGETEELMRSSYTEYAVVNLDGDATEELLLIQADSVGSGTVELYSYQDDAMILRSSAPMSASVAGTVLSVRQSRLTDRTQALLVTSACAEDQRLTDIFCLRDGLLVNATRSDGTFQSDSTIRAYTGVEIQDINRDGILEIPMPVVRANPDSAGEEFWILEWRQFDSDGVAWPVMQTYHNTGDRWYLELPEGWAGRTTIARPENTPSGERTVTFSRTVDEAGTAEVFLSISRLTGTNRSTRAQRAGRILLASERDALYTGEFNPDCSWDVKLTGTQLQGRFHLIETDWRS